MSILQNVNPPTDQLTAGVTRIKTQLQSVYRQMTNLLTQQSNFVWHNSQHTPQEVLTAFGTDAAELLQFGTMLGTVVQRSSGQAIKVIPDGYSVNAHSDGSVSIAGVPVGTTSTTNTATVTPQHTPTPVRPTPTALRPDVVTNTTPSTRQNSPQRMNPPTSQQTRQGTESNRHATIPMPARQHRPVPSEGAPSAPASLASNRQPPKAAPPTSIAAPAETTPRPQ